jgi:hypothetical protein
MHGRQESVYDGTNLVGYSCTAAPQNYHFKPAHVPRSSGKLGFNCPHDKQAAPSHHARNNKQRVNGYVRIKCGENLGGY